MDRGTVADMIMSGTTAGMIAAVRLTVGTVAVAEIAAVVTVAAAVGISGCGIKVLAVL
jgi:hypothetical protein